MFAFVILPIHFLGARACDVSRVSLLLLPRPVHSLPPRCADASSWTPPALDSIPPPPLLEILFLRGAFFETSRSQL